MHPILEDILLSISNFLLFLIIDIKAKFGFLRRDYQPRVDMDRMDQLENVPSKKLTRQRKQARRRSSVAIAEGFDNLELLGGLDKEKGREESGEVEEDLVEGCDETTIIATNTPDRVRKADRENIPSSKSKPKSKSKPTSSPNPTQTTNQTTPIPPTMSTKLLPRKPTLRKLLVISLGNPAPYTNTLHSTGHLLLTHLQKTQSHTYPPFSSPQKAYGNTLMSRSVDPNIPVILAQSTSMMNNSGTGVLAAYKRFLNDDIQHLPPGSEDQVEGLLVIIHDELELALGEIKVKAGGASCKGHNGLKSIRERLTGWDGQVPNDLSKWSNPSKKGGMMGRWVRIGVGIGRPLSREKEDVSKYVLGKIGGRERGVLEGCVGAVQRELEGFWRGGSIRNPAK